MPTNRTVLSNSFEGLLMMTNQTNFAQGDTFSGWQVMTNGVAVFSGTNHLFSNPLFCSTKLGTKFPPLRNGQESLAFGSQIIIPDKKYTLKLIHPKISTLP